MTHWNYFWANPAPVWDRVRAVLFEPCRTAQRGRPWEDCQ
jgi:hypothetical protein